LSFRGLIEAHLQYTQPLCIFIGCCLSGRSLIEAAASLSGAESTAERNAVTAIVKADVDEETMKEAEAVLRTMGLSTSAVVNLLIERIAKDKALPFQPNAETIEAARRGELVTVSDGHLIDSLDADD